MRHTCKQCGNSFDDVKKHRKFCSMACRSLFLEAGRKWCTNCGSSYLSYEPTMQYCSLECYNNVRRKRAKATQKKLPFSVAAKILEPKSSIQFTRNPKKSFVQQICDYLKTYGASTPAQIRHGISKNTESARFITQTIVSVLAKLERQGHVDRERCASTSIYTIKVRSAETRKRKKMPKDGVAKELISTLTKLSELVDAELRLDVFAEMFLRVSMGMYDPQKLNGLLAASVRHVKKEFRGGWRESFSVDAPLTETGFNLLDILQEESYEGTKDLTKLEERVDFINFQLGEGYDEQQIRHLWDTSNTTWPYIQQITKVVRL